MKKLAVTIAIVLGLVVTDIAAPKSGGLFQLGNTPDNNNEVRSGFMAPKLPVHNEEGNQDAPIGSSIVALTAFGLAYLIGKKRNVK